MKTLLLLFSLGAVSISFGQLKTIELDFKNKDIDGLDIKLSKGDLYRFRVTNINMNVYKVQLSQTDTNFLNPLDFSAFSILDPSGFSGLISGINHTISVLPDISTRAFFSDSSRTEKSFVDSLEIYKSALGSLSNEVKSLSEQLAKDLKETENYFKRAYLLNHSYNLQFSETNDIIEEMAIYQKQLDSISNLTDSLNSLFIQLLEVNKDLLKDKVNKDSANAVENHFVVLNGAIINLKKQTSEEVALKLFSKYVDLINNSSNTYTSLPLQIYGDHNELKISITPQDSASRLPSYEATYYVPRVSRFYIGIGPGVYFSHLSDQQFSSRGQAITDTTSGYQMVSESGNSYEIGLSAIAHAGWKIRRLDWFGIHGSFGGGLSFTDPARLRVMYGGGFTFGYKHCLTLDFLATTGYVNIQSNAVNETEIYKEKPESYTVSKIKTAFGFSVGYTFTF
jgi:hypothetical protein